MQNDKLICCKCNVALEPRNTDLSYMGYHFNATLPRCPVCGLVYIDEELATGKIAQVEMQLEDK